MDIDTALKEAMEIDGALGVSLVDYESGMALGSLGGGKYLNLEVASAGNTEVVRAKMRTLESLGLKESIDEGTQFVVFEPNSPALWQRIIRSVGDFLYNQWREGALFGETAKQAFFVKCDAELNPASVREAGQVITEIGVAIVKPAEFVIFRIEQTTDS